MIKDFIKRLVQLEDKIMQDIKSKEPTKKIDDIKEGVDILSMNPNKDPSDTNSSLEFILNVMSR